MAVVAFLQQLAAKETLKNVKDVNNQGTMRGNTYRMYGAFIDPIDGSPGSRSMSLLIAIAGVAIYGHRVGLPYYKTV